jgi:hypothetical protein
MQATTVLLLELAFHSQHVPEKANMVLKAAKKAINWLSALSKTNMASERAWKLCDGFLRRLAPHIGIDVNEMSDNEGSSSNSLFDVPDGLGSTELGDDPLVDDLSFDQSSTLPAAPVVTAESIAAEMDSIACSPIEPPVSPLDMSVSYSLEAPDLLDTLTKSENSLSGPLPYDELFPYDPATGQITGSFFPSGPNIDLDMGYFWGDAVC